MERGGDDAAAQFMVGLLSRLDVLLGMPLKEILERLPVRPEIRSALLDPSSPHARTLATAVAYENADWDTVREHSAHGAFKLNALMEAYAQATEWAGERLSQAQS